MINDKIDKGYENLAHAIILTAANEYRDLLNGGKVEPDKNIPEIERFFKSSWFETLTHVDGKYLMDKLKREITIPERRQKYVEHQTQ